MRRLEHYRARAQCFLVVAAMTPHQRVQWTLASRLRLLASPADALRWTSGDKHLAT